MLSSSLLYGKFIRKEVGFEGQILFAQHYYKIGTISIFKDIGHVINLVDIYILLFSEQGQFIHTIEKQILRMFKTLFSPFLSEIQYIHSYSFAS